MSDVTLTLSERRERQAAHQDARTTHLASREALLTPRRSNDELRAIAEAAHERLADTDTDTVLAWVGQEFGYRTAVACSMADAVLPAVVARHLPWVDTLFLETGYHFAETIGTRDAVEASMRLTIVDVRPRLSVAEQDAEFGEKLYERDPGLCCAMRKVEPLHETLQGYEVWITGVRRDEGPTRANTPFISWDDKNSLVKINPLAAWTFDDLLAYAESNDIIVNPLVNDGYPSIGCATCTRRVAPGEDPRAGRWAGLDKTECGLHT
ncbi:phosphoadenylyl-sulfate reductase [Aeromicrobium chenweiae]|uniref:Adenosine 5'-phosphosulfate reductase n=1 Tax=Aeromicrobium chenweiae TaxID=2079793 RepID=A0A2S0WS22_9ACTN|nr:phosphoadenylyl-sulfate reductase [Aeromicrobium chenweiae]AWB94127.1 phosphoadenylyl-sulfate reductase [Aeromicrobium chenweiae]TGN31281.1 phosphoadenylyl-sulfate reductase [Aeromicrobium chenweiae]